MADYDKHEVLNDDIFIVGSNCLFDLHLAALLLRPLSTDLAVEPRLVPDILFFMDLKDVAIYQASCHLLPEGH